VVGTARNDGIPVDGGASHGPPDNGAAMIGTVSAIVVGLAVGALARLVMPGKENVGIIMTTVLGALGSLIGSWLCYRGVGIAVILITVYLGPTGRRAGPPTVR